MERIKKYNTGGYTQINNKVLMDIRLSLKAKAIYAYLLSKPNGWIFHVDVIKKEIKESYRVILLAIKELIEAGYLKRNQVNKNGCFGGIEYEFIDVYRMHENRQTVKPHAEKPSDGKCAYNNTDVSKTDILNNTYSYIPTISPLFKGGYDERFEEFWKMYLPVKCTDGRFTDKGSKQEAYKAFKKALQKDSFENIKEGLKRYLKKKSVCDSMTANVSTFLNKERWKDEIEKDFILSEKTLRKQEEDSGQKLYDMIVNFK